MKQRSRDRFEANIHTLNSANKKRKIKEINPIRPETLIYVTSTAYPGLSAEGTRSISSNNTNPIDRIIVTPSILMDFHLRYFGKY